MAKSQEELDMLKETFGSVSENSDSQSNQEENKDSKKEEEKKDVKAEAKVETKEDNAFEVEDASEEKKDEEKKDIVVEADINEDAILAYLKKSGIEVSSIDELRPKASPEDAVEKREERKISYALQNNLITKKQYDSYVADSANKNDLVYASLAKELKEEKSDISNEEIQEEFAEIYAINAEPESSKYKRGQRLLNQEADRLIKEKHAAYFGIDSKYSDFEKDTSATAEKNKKILNNSATYVKNVDDSLVELSTINFKLGDSTYSVKIPAETIKGIKDAFLDKATSEKNILSDISKDDIKGAIEMSILKGNFEKIVTSLVNKRLEAKAKGAQGVPVDDVTLRRDDKKPTKEFAAGELEYFKEAGLPQPKAN